MKSKEHYKQQRIVRETIAREAALARFLSDNTPEIDELKFTIMSQKIALILTMLLSACLFLQHVYVFNDG